MISFIIINLILPILLVILSSWVYDSIKDMRYQNAILLIMESREVRLSYFSEFFTLSKFSISITRLFYFLLLFRFLLSSDTHILRHDAFRRYCNLNGELSGECSYGIAH